MKKIFFEPSKLRTASREIKKIHQNTGMLFEPLSVDQCKEIVEEVCAQNPKDLESYSKFIPLRKLMYLAEYLPINVFKVDLTNIVKVLEFRFNGDIFRTVYKSWQNQYRSHYEPLCRQFLIWAVKECESEYIIEHDLEKVLEGWLICNDLEKMEYNVCRSIMNYRSCKNCKYSDVEIFYDIYNSRLAYNAAMWFYCCGSKEDYLACTDIQLSGIIAGMKNKVLNLFMLNFLDVLEVKEMTTYKTYTWKTFSNNIGAPGSEKFNSFFNQQHVNIDTIKRKYILWYNIQQADKVFMDNDRGWFWKNKVFEYDVVEYKLISSSKAILMRFDDYVVIEFWEEGPIYFFSYDFYQNKIKSFFEGNHKSLQDKKYILFHTFNNKENPPVEGFENRIIHHRNQDSRWRYGHLDKWMTDVNRKLKNLTGR